MTTPNEVVRAYMDHLQQESYIRTAVAQHGIPALIEAVVRLVETLQPEDVGDAGLFVRDLATGVLGADLANETRSLLPSSGLFQALALCLNASSFPLRSQAVYTLGKLTFPENVPLLDEAFRDRRDIDPLLMPDLLFELLWLERDHDALWTRTRSLADSPNVISRWAALAVIDRHFKHEPVPAVDHILSQCSRDSFAPIRAEAAYRRAECDRLIRNGKLTKEQFKLERKRIRAERSVVGALRPKMTFDVLARLFWDGHRGVDYGTVDVLAFLTSHGASDAG